MAQSPPTSPIPTLAEPVARDPPEARSTLSAQLGRGGAVKQGRQMARSLVAFDTAYIRWRAEFARFEANCFDALCDFVRAHFDNLIDRYYGEGYEALNDFPAWAFERYLWEGAP